MPEQEFLPPRPSARSYRPDRDDEDPPPWANLPPVRPARPARPRDPGFPGGRPGGPQRPPEIQRPLESQPPGFQRPEYQRPAAAPRPATPQYRADAEYPADAQRSAATRPSAGSRRPAAAGQPVGPPDPAGLTGPEPANGLREDEAPLQEPVPQWAAGEADDGETAPRVPPREPSERRVRAAARRRRRWLVMVAALVVVAGAVTAVVLLTGGGPGPAAVTPAALITTFQPGELRQVPQACHVVPAATVQQYLPGKAKQSSPLPVNGTAGSACNWSIDKAPVYRLMELNMFAYAPNGLASGDGSATYAAIDGYDSALQALQSPPKGSPSPRATMTMLPGFGNQAFSAMQVFRAGGAVTDVATVVVRYHNVLVTATLNGLEHSNRGSYGPVSQPQLASAALAFAQAAEASLHEGQVTPRGH